MTTPLDGGAAFPTNMNQYGITKTSGMSLRAYFAGQALMGMCANADISKAMSKAGLRPQDVRLSFASSAVKQADALMAELGKDRYE